MKLRMTAVLVASIAGSLLWVGNAAARTPVDDSYKVPFRFTGKIDKLTFKLGPEQITAQERDEMLKALARARD